MKIIGHRGCGADRPENTAVSLQRALELGVDGIEVDIWPTKDEGFVLVHDADICSLTGTQGWPIHLTKTILQQIDVGARFGPGYEGERIISLEQALEIIAGKIEVFLELKRTRHDEESVGWIEPRLADLLRAHGAVPWTVVVSFDHRALQALKSYAPEIRTGMLYAGEWLNLWDEVALLAPDMLLPHWAQTTRALVHRAHAQALEVLPWIVNQEYVLERLVDVSVDGVVTDFPERCALRLAAMGTQQRDNKEV